VTKEVFVLASEATLRSKAVAVLVRAEEPVPARKVRKIEAMNVELVADRVDGSRNAAALRSRKSASPRGGEKA